jgi:hypothetical protein
MKGYTVDHNDIFSMLLKNTYEHNPWVLTTGTSVLRLRSCSVTQINMYLCTPNMCFVFTDVAEASF